MEEIIRELREKSKDSIDATTAEITAHIQLYGSKECLPLLTLRNRLHRLEGQYAAYTQVLILMTY